jgi:two-component system sensor histidine kinase CiaH
MFRSATIRLTAWYVLMVSIICILFSVAFYRVATSELTNSLQRETHRLVIDQRIDLGYSMNLMEDSLAQGSRRILLNLLIFDAFLLGAGTVGSYFLAKRTLEPIEAAHEAQRRFASDASHELRTPLTAMKAEIEVMLRDKKPEVTALKEQLQSNLEEIAKLEALSTGLLQLAKYEEDDNSLEMIRLDLKVIALTAQDRLKKAASHRRIMLITNLSQADAMGDKASLVELTAVLLDNAIKYSPEGSEVIITTMTEGKRAKLSVVDHGIGILAEDLPRIFDRFYQADTSRTKQKTQGYGLGLSLAKAIAEHHGGDIIVESVEGEGTRVTIELPQVKPLVDTPTAEV